MIGRMLLAAGWLACFVHTVLPDQPAWDGLRVTFGSDPRNPNFFVNLPRTKLNAERDGWTKIADCDRDSRFQGARYVKDNDYAVVLLFDINGYIAGIQCGIAKTGLPSNYPPSKQRGNIFQDDGDYFTLTAYFVNPATICASGRSTGEYSTQGTGTDLYIQNGSDPLTESVRIPSSQADVNSTCWTLGKCVHAMGVHYWYNISTGMDCEDFQPVFLLYNGDRLTAFGWALGSNETSPRFEHPPHALISVFMNSVPTCLYHYDTLSTMHIYMTADPTLNVC